jgi:hypothetical protein
MIERSEGRKVCWEGKKKTGKLEKLEIGRNERDSMEMRRERRGRDEKRAREGEKEEDMTIVS